MLNQKDKFERFAQVINENAEKKCGQINEQIEETYHEQMGIIEKSAQETLDRRLRAEMNKAQMEINRKASLIQSQSKMLVASYREEISEKVFCEVAQRLKDFCLTDAYEEYLKKSVLKISDILGAGFSLLVREQDKEKIEKLTEGLNQVSQIKCDDEIIIGGFIAVSEDGSVRVDCTLEAELEEQKEWFRANSFLKV